MATENPSTLSNRPVDLTTSTTSPDTTNAAPAIPHPNITITNTFRRQRPSRLPIPPGFSASDYQITSSTRREYKTARKSQQVFKRAELHQQFVLKLKAAVQVERQLREDLKDSMVKASKMGYTEPIGESGEGHWDSVWKVYSGRSRANRQTHLGNAEKRAAKPDERHERNEEEGGTHEVDQTPGISGWCEDLEHPIPPELWPPSYKKHHRDQVELLETLTEAETYYSTSDNEDNEDGEDDNDIDDDQKLLLLLQKERLRSMTDVHCGSSAKQNVKRLLKKLKRKKKAQPEPGLMPVTWSKLAVKSGLRSGSHGWGVEDTSAMTGRLSTPGKRVRSVTIPSGLQRSLDDSHAYSATRDQDSAGQSQPLISHAYASPPDLRERQVSANTPLSGTRQRARSTPLAEFDSHGWLKLPPQIESLMDQVNKANEQNGVYYAEPFNALPNTESVENLRLACGARLDQVSKAAADEALEVIRKERELKRQEQTTMRNTLLNRAKIPTSSKGPNGIYAPGGSSPSSLNTNPKSASPNSPQQTGQQEEPSSSSPPKSKSSTPSPKSIATSKSTPPSARRTPVSSPPVRKETPDKSKPRYQKPQTLKLRKTYNKISKETPDTNADVYANGEPAPSAKKVRFTVFQDSVDAMNVEGKNTGTLGKLEGRDRNAKLGKQQSDGKTDKVLEEVQELVREDRRERAKEKGNEGLS
ncbi:hypothetical protein BDV96DRAFT_646444 [Lophiotrema nucula]|uniref:Uncharacterized protein n=1 Tax=Lophiotrema nucula TaxID=690887 RepID=A0A6A5ZAM0_9PLEO|nr:hypothetical protein BDV96DRAFT_646444 [Lophiotrema nucula]